MVIMAPYPHTEVVSVLPNPRFNDIKQGQSEVVVHTSVDGEIRTYTKLNSRTLLSFVFANLVPEKVEELRQVFSEYHASEMRLMLTWKDRSYRAYLKTNPWQSIFNAKDAENIAFEFEGILL